jgi:hypothetical protein
LVGTGARRRLRDLVLRRGSDDRFVAREDLARRYLRGGGIEIGALTWPLRVPPGTRVRYVDPASCVGRHRDRRVQRETDVSCTPIGGQKDISSGMDAKVPGKSYVWVTARSNSERLPGPPPTP